MSFPNLRIAAPTPFFSGSNNLANGPSPENASFNPPSIALPSSPKFTRPRICLPRIG